MQLVDVATPQSRQLLLTTTVQRRLPAPLARVDASCWLLALVRLTDSHMTLLAPVDRSLCPVGLTEIQSARLSSSGSSSLPDYNDSKSYAQLIDRHWTFCDRMCQVMAYAL